MTKTKDELIAKWSQESYTASIEIGWDTQQAEIVSEALASGARKMYDHRQKELDTVKAVCQQEIDELRKFADAVITYLDCVKRKWADHMSDEEEHLMTLFERLPK